MPAIIDGPAVFSDDDLLRLSRTNPGWQFERSDDGALLVSPTSTPGGAKNALLLAAGLVVFTTIINMIGVKLMARINNFGVMAELIGVSVLIILLAVHIRRGPGVIFDTFGTGKGYPWGYFGAFLVAGLMPIVATGCLFLLISPTATTIPKA